MRYTDDVLQNCTPDAYIMLLTTVTPINSIKFLFLKREYLEMGFRPKRDYLTLAGRKHSKREVTTLNKCVVLRKK